MNKAIKNSYSCFRKLSICDYIWDKAVWDGHVAASWKTTKYDLHWNRSNVTNVAGEMIMELILICKTCWESPYITIVVDWTILWFKGREHGLALFGH